MGTSETKGLPLRDLMERDLAAWRAAQAAIAKAMGR